jgi:iron complex transport system ATP-binding protein
MTCAETSQLEREGLALKDFGIRRGRTRILEGVDCSLGTGRLVALVGPNGAGKSSVLGALAGLLPHSGQARLAGKPLSRAAVAFLPQHSHTGAELTVLQTVLLGRHERLGWHVGEQDLADAVELLDETGLAPLAARPLCTLSGGQQQLVLLAQRLIRRPRLLLLDEATSALDIRHQIEVFERLRLYSRRTGALIVIAVHDLNLAARHADATLLLAGGTLLGPAAFDALVTPERLREAYGIEAEFLRSSAGKSVVVPIATADNGARSRFPVPSGVT